MLDFIAVLPSCLCKHHFGDIILVLDEIGCLPSSSSRCEITSLLQLHSSNCTADERRMTLFLHADDVGDRIYARERFGHMHP